jgi:regulatory protein
MMADMSDSRHRKRASDPRTAYDAALGLLARREQSRRELRQRLDRRGYDAAESDAALDRLAQDHYQDDARFGEMLVRTRIAQGYGPARLRAELGSHGLPDALVRDLVAHADVDWFERACSQLRKHYPAPARERSERARQAQYLLRRGFDAGIARRAVERRMDDTDDSGDNM